MSKSATDNTPDSKTAGTQSSSFLDGILAGKRERSTHLQSQQFWSFTSSPILGRCLGLCSPSLSSSLWFLITLNCMLIDWVIPDDISSGVIGVTAIAISIPSLCRRCMYLVMLRVLSHWMEASLPHSQWSRVIPVCDKRVDCVVSRKQDKGSNLHLLNVFNWLSISVTFNLLSLIAYGTYRPYLDI